MRDWLIKKLGGYTQSEYENVCYQCNDMHNELTRRGDTIQELQALVPVSAVLPKKRGRPRKYAGKA